jgi:hypothetical protein
LGSGPYKPLVEEQRQIIRFKYKQKSLTLKMSPLGHCCLSGIITILLSIISFKWN